MKDIDLQVGQTCRPAGSSSHGCPFLERHLSGCFERGCNSSTIRRRTSLQVVGQQQITDLPINGRRVDSFALMTPGVTNDATFGLLSFRGVAGNNSFLLDGNDNTEQFYDENAGRTRIQSQLSQDAVQEFQVVSDNFSAEYGRAMGGVVNTVTKSGTN